MGIAKPWKLFSNIFNNEIIPDENFPDYGIMQLEWVKVVMHQLIGQISEIGLLATFGNWFFLADFGESFSNLFIMKSREIY